MDNLEKSQGPQGNAPFIARLRQCVDRAKSARSFAESASIPPSTLHSYLTGVEPQRPALINLARAAGVSLQWLATGTDDAGNPESPFLALLDPQVFRRNLKILVEKSGGASRLAEKTGLPEEKIEGLVVRGAPSLADVLALAQSTGSIDALLAETVVHNFGAPLSKEEVSRNQMAREPSLRGVTFGRWLDITRSLAELSSFDGDITWRIQPDDSMSPTIERDDLIVAARRTHIGEQGVYLVRSSQKSVVCRVISEPNGRLLLSYDNENYRHATCEFDSSVFEVLGRVFFRVTRLDPPRDKKRVVA